LTEAIFDPSAVHVWGQLPTTTCLRGAITEFDKPETYAVGFECRARSPYLRGTKLVYQDPDRNNQLYEFFVDDVTTATPAKYTYPKTPGANDRLISTPCPVEFGKSKGPAGFVVGPTGRLIYGCYEVLRGYAIHWYEDGKEVLPNQTHAIVALGYDDLVLLGGDVGGCTGAWTTEIGRASCRERVSNFV
jgi:hypothetical protein